MTERLRPKVCICWSFLTPSPRLRPVSDRIRTSWNRFTRAVRAATAVRHRQTVADVAQRWLTLAPRINHDPLRPRAAIGALALDSSAKVSWHRLKRAGRAHRHAATCDGDAPKPAHTALRLHPCARTRHATEHTLGGTALRTCIGRSRVPRRTVRRSKCIDSAVHSWRIVARHCGIRYPECIWRVLHRLRASSDAHHTGNRQRFDKPSRSSFSPLHDSPRRRIRARNNSPKAPSQSSSKREA
jgi:hypothetical protein